MTIPIPKITTHTHTTTTHTHYWILASNRQSKHLKCDRQSENVPTRPASKSESLWICLWTYGNVYEPMDMLFYMKERTNNFECKRKRLSSFIHVETVYHESSQKDRVTVSVSMVTETDVSDSVIMKDVSRWRGAHGLKGRDTHGMLSSTTSRGKPWDFILWTNFILLAYSTLWLYLC